MAAFRYLIRHRGNLLLTTATLVLAVGANLLVFTIINALWLRPRPVHEPDRLVMVMGDPGATGSMESFFFGEEGLQRWVRAAPAFELVAGQVMTSGSNVVLTPRVAFRDATGNAETIGVTPEYFKVLGVPVRGRDFVADDDQPGASAVAIVSDRIWREAFGAQIGVLGRVVPASPFPVRIIGVAPPGFHGARLGEDVDVWVPRHLVLRLSALPGLPQGSTPLLAIARLRMNVSVVDAQRLVREQAGQSIFLSQISVVPLSLIYGSPNHRTLVINEGPVVQMIAMTSLLVLLGGCATLTTLVLVHYERRRQEFAVRLALGASRGRLLARLGGELTWIAAAGCGGALLVADRGIRVMPALDLPGGVNLARLNLGLDWRVAAAALGASVLALAAAAILPLIRATGRDVARHLITPSATADVGSLRLRKLFLAVHVGSTVIVIVAAALFVRTVHRGFADGAGFDTDATLFASVDVSSPYALSALQASERRRGVSVPSSEVERRAETARLGALLADERREVAGRVVTALSGWPEIERLAIGAAPLGPDRAIQIAAPRRFETIHAAHQLRVGQLSVSPDYIPVLGLRTIAGRPLGPRDATSHTEIRPAVITGSLATRLFAGQSAVGQRLRIGDPGSAAELDVVGVVNDFAFGSMRFDPAFVILLVRRADDPVPNTLELVLRSRDAALVDRLQRRLAEVVPSAPRLSVVTGRDLVATDLGRERLGAWFFSGFGLVALSLAVGGVFGLVTYLADARRREFGVRVALGATSGNITRLTLTAGLIPALAGALVGLAAAAWLERVAASRLLVLGPFDVAGYAIAFALIAGLTCTAGLAASWRVRRISPMEALRSD
jgi:hypothetical protein